MTENGSNMPPCTSEASDVESTRLGEREWIDRTEYLRLIIQALHDLGHGCLATELERASGVRHEEQNVVDLRLAVLRGDWEQSLTLLRSIPIENDGDRRRAQFLFLEEKFLEAMEQKEWKKALRYLRSELAPLNVNTDRLHLLATCLMCPTVDDLKSIARWDGPTDASRAKVLEALQGIVSPHVMLPQRRLVRLLEQSIQHQMENCVFHNSAHAMPSLFVDYSVGMEQIPTEVVQELCDHTDEVWHVQFSHDGKSLASCSKDGVSIIWEMRSHRKIEKKLVLKGHTKPVVYLAWSPNDKYLASTSQDATLRVWDTESGECIRMIADNSELGTTVGWMPDSKRFISGSSNGTTDQTLNMWNLEGRKLRTWGMSRVQDLVVSKAGDRLIVMGTDKKIRIIDLEDAEKMGVIELDVAVTAISVSDDGLRLLASTQDREIHLWELNRDLTRPQPREPKKRYKLPVYPAEPPKYIIWTCFGGHNEAFVLSGSEECKVYVWHKQTEKLLAELEGHSGVVNSVSWNPVDPSMFASASDDKSVQIWTTKSKAQPQW